MVNPTASLFVLSCRTGAGVEDWVGWLLERWQAFLSEKVGFEAVP